MLVELDTRVVDGPSLQASYQSEQAGKVTRDSRDELTLTTYSQVPTFTSHPPSSFSHIQDPARNGKTNQKLNLNPKQT